MIAPPAAPDLVHLADWIASGAAARRARRRHRLARITALDGALRVLQAAAAELPADLVLARALVFLRQLRARQVRR